MKYMKGLHKVGSMSDEERRAYAIRMQAKWQQEAMDKKEVTKAPTVDVTKPGIESVNYTTFRELRKANKFDFLVTFYAPWCPYCKKYVLNENAPINALGASLDEKKGLYAVKYDMVASDPPISLDGVPTVVLYKRTGEAITYEGDAFDLEKLKTWAFGHATTAEQWQRQKLQLISKHSNQQLRGHRA